MSEKILRLQAKEDIENNNEKDLIEIQKDVICKFSSTVNNMLDDLSDNNETETVPLPNVSKNILERIVSYCNHHYDNPQDHEITDTNSSETNPSEDDKKKPQEICEWDKEFLSVDQSVLFETILAANYMDMKRLLDDACKTVANMIKNKSPEEIRMIFNIKNDFTPEEEEQIRKENEWCMEL